MFINVQILPYFFHVTFQNVSSERKNLKNTDVLGNVGLGLGKTVHAENQMGGLVFSS